MHSSAKDAATAAAGADDAASQVGDVEDVGQAGRMATTVVQLLKMRWSSSRLPAGGAGVRGTTAANAGPNSAVGAVVVDMISLAAELRPTNKQTLVFQYCRRRTARRTANL